MLADPRAPSPLPGRALDEVDLAAIGPLYHDADRGVLLSRRARIVGSDTPVRREELGVLSLPSGQVLACDPTYEDFELPAFAREVRPGRYPVVLTRVGGGEAGGGTVAAAALIFRDEAPARWELALLPDQRLADLRFGELYGYGVDGKTGCFVDLKHAKIFGASHHARLREAHERAGYGAFVYALRGEPAVAVFPSGGGDGVYASYWGLDRKGEPVCLVTDFGELSEPVRVRVRFGEDGLRVAALEHPALARVGAAARVTEASAAGVAFRFEGAVHAIADATLVARRGGDWAPVAARFGLTWEEGVTTYALHPPTPADGPLALELAIVVGAVMVRAEEEPQPKSPVLRRRRT